MSAESSLFVADFTGADNASIQLFAADKVPDDLRMQLRAINHQALLASLPYDQWYRADKMLHPGRPDNSYKQPSGDATLAVINLRGEPVGAVLTATDVPARTNLRAVKARLPWERDLRLHDAYLRPGLSSSDPTAENDSATRVSGLVIGALYHSMTRTSWHWKLTAHVQEFPKGIVFATDRDMANLVGAVGLYSAGTKERYGLPGYPSIVSQRRFEGPIRGTTKRILGMAGAQAALEDMAVTEM